MKLKISFIFLLALFLYGCGKVIKPEQYDSIKEGMSYQQVTDILGFEGEEETNIPDSVKMENSNRYVWVDRKGSVVLCVFINNKMFLKTAGLVEDK